MLPLVDGHTLSVIVSVGAPGVVQLPGTVVTPADSGLVTLLSRSQLQRVLIVCAGPVWAYVGRVLLHAPPFTLYCSVLPVGQPVAGALMLPPLTVQDEVQLLLVTCTSAGALVRLGQQTVGLVVALTVLLTQLVVVLRQRA